MHCQPLGVWRDKVFAHTDREMRVHAGSKAPPEVDQSGFETALAGLLELLREAHHHFNGQGATMLFPVRTNDADALMGYIRAGYDARQAEIASQFP